MGLSSQHHSFDIKLAAKYGVEEAILIHHFQHWIRFNRELNQNIIDGRCWTYQTRKQIKAHFPYWNFDKVKYLCEKLVQLDVLVTSNHNKAPFDKTLWYAFSDEEFFGVNSENSKNVYEGQKCPSKGKSAPSKGKSAPPIPNAIPANPLGIANKAIPNPIPSEVLDEALDLDLPFSFQKIEEPQLPKAKGERKFPRTPDQEETFQWLKCLGLNTHENTLSFWASKYPRHKLQAVYDHLQFKLSKGYKPKNIGGFFTNLLKTENSPITQECLDNKKFAEGIKNHLGWSSLKLSERFCNEETRPDYDLPYCIDTASFRERLETMWNIKKGSRNKPSNQPVQADYEENYDD